jgi:hypothetical protein
MANKGNNLGQTFRYNDILTPINKVVVKDYWKSDQKRREMLRLHNPDIDWDKVEQEKPDGQE